MRDTLLNSRRRRAGTGTGSGLPGTSQNMSNKNTAYPNPAKAYRRCRIVSDRIQGQYQAGDAQGRQRVEQQVESLSEDKRLFGSHAGWHERIFHRYQER